MKQVNAKKLTLKPNAVKVTMHFRQILMLPLKT